MTHNYLFTYYSILIYLVIRFYKKPKTSAALGIGSIVGLAALTRPTEIIWAMVPVLFGVNMLSHSSIINRVNVIISHYKKFVLAGLATAIIGFTQMAYWKYVAGEWFVYSYQDQGFSWLSPHLIDGFFSYRCGWLIYTPMMFFAIAGFIFLYRKYKQLFFVSFIFFLLFSYVVFAWDIWWYGGSLGQRTMVQLYPILALPFASFLEWTLGRRNKLLFGLITVLFALFCFHNLWFTHQAHKGGLFKSEQMTKRYFWSTLYTFKEKEENLKYLDTEYVYNGDVSESKTLEILNFDSDSTIICAHRPIDGSRSFCLNKEVQFSPNLSIPKKEVVGNRLRASVDVRCTQKEWNYWKMTQLVVAFKLNGKDTVVKKLRLHRFLHDNLERNIHLDVKVPSLDFDEIQVYVWNANGDKELIIDNLKLISFKD